MLRNVFESLRQKSRLLSYNRPTASVNLVALSREISRDVPLASGLKKAISASGRGKLREAHQTQKFNLPRVSPMAIRKKSET
jgi:hypothetical protein